MPSFAFGPSKKSLSPENSLFHMVEALLVVKASGLINMVYPSEMELLRAANPRCL